MHLSDELLALYAGGDLRLWARIRAAAHVRRCDRCSRRVDEFRSVREFLETGRDAVPDGVNWNRLAAEMSANIRLGLAAGQCVAQPELEPMRLPWRTPAVALPVLLLVVLGWVLQTVPPTAPPSSAAAAVILESGPAGIGFEQGGRGFQLLHPTAAGEVISSVGVASVRSRYVDSDTEQVTISHVYAD